MKLSLLSKANYVRRPWKNGRGESLEIAIHPSTADFASEPFLFRLSQAKLPQAALGADAGPTAFSLFPEHERTLLITQGPGLVLHIRDHLQRDVETLVRLPAHQLFTFSGAQHVTAEPVSEPMTDFNVFARRGSVTARISLQKLEPPRDNGPIQPFLWRLTQPTPTWAFAFALSGSAYIEPGGLRLQEGDTLKVEEPSASEHVAFSLDPSSPETEIRLVIIELTRVSRSSKSE